MQTECPHCHTLFRLTEAQIDMADGLVRCGYCEAVFNALQTGDFIDNDRQLDAFEDTAVADHADSKSTTEQEVAGPARVSIDDASGHADTETPGPVRDDVISNLFADEHNELVPDRFRSERPGISAWSTLLWSVAVLLLITSLLAEYAWFNRDQLLNQPQLQPHIAKLCEHISCNAYFSLRDPANIEMISRNVYTHPSAQSALMISATMVNNAGFSQAYPDVRIDFSNIRGEVLASRRFSPAEYLQLDRGTLDQMQPNSPVTFGLEIIDPGRDAITYEFMFL